jgi:putative ABC transport system permease protein
MIAPRFVPLILRQVYRAPMRTGLTISGVAVAMFLFAAVQAMQAGVEAATTQQAGDTTLVVYRKDRYCPYSSQMPQSYEQQMQRIPGVASVVPMKIVVSNCRTSLDVVTFRGVPRDRFFDTMGDEFEVIEGSLADWERRSDAALVGEVLAQRRGFKVGDQFEAAGITAYVAGIIRSDEPQNQNVAYAHLDFLQFASGSRSGGIVTQFLVKVDDPGQLDTVAGTIDEAFATAQEPTQTSAEKAFVARAAADIIEIVGFMGWLGWGCLFAVLALVGNAIVLSVQDRVREHAVFQTLGYSSNLIARLIVAEGVFVSLAGALVGCGASLVVLAWGGFAMTVESHSVPIAGEPAIFVWGVLIATGLGVLAGAVPAWQASRRDIVSCFRAV